MKQKKFLKKSLKSKNIFYSPMALSEIIEHELSGIQEIANYYDIIISIRGLDKEKKDLLKLKRLYPLQALSQKEVINQIEQLIEEETIWRNVAFKFLIKLFRGGIGEVKQKNIKY